MLPRRNSDQETEGLRARLAGRGLRVTPQRVAVLRGLGQMQGPASHYEVADQLEPRQMDRATVYRNLVALAEAGLVVRTQMADGVWRYELASETASHGVHPHLMCTDCGQVSCLPSASVKLRGVEAVISEVHLRGRCAACVRP